MKVSLTTTDKIIFGIVAILAAVVLALILFGCNGVGVTDADGGVDAGSDAGDTDTDAPSGRTTPPAWKYAHRKPPVCFSTPRQQRAIADV